MSKACCHLCSPPAELEGEELPVALIVAHLRAVHLDRPEPVNLQLRPDGTVDVRP